MRFRRVFCLLLVFLMALSCAETPEEIVEYSPIKDVCGIRMHRTRYRMTVSGIRRRES